MTSPEAGGPPPITWGVLGEAEVRLHGRPLPLGHARQRSVLVALAVEAGSVVSVDALVDRVWGERPPSRARSALSTYLTHLRRALAPAEVAITRRGTGYLLDTTPDTVDLHRFRRLPVRAREQREAREALALVEDALALWRGEPLAELDSPWARAVRERLHRERAAAEADRVDWALACGRHHGVLPELTARADAEPLDERVVGQLMLALYRSGRQADALTRYQRTRHHLTEQLGADPGPALRDLYQRILVADPGLTPAGPDAGVRAGAVTGPVVVPRQLPAAPRSFTGRAGELAALEAATTCVIGGAGGMGKTWLALTWAHEHLDRFPDGQLFVDLRGFGPDGTPTDPSAVLRGFLDALAVPPDRAPADQDARGALFRSLVSDKRVLVFLDNAASTDQVVPLLPGGNSCTVLVTSRNHLPGLVTAHGARHLALDVLTDADSHALLAARLGTGRTTAEPAATAELVGLCGGFPLALGIIAARAHTHPDLPLAEFAAELREAGLAGLDDSDPAASLPTVLSWSLHHLTAEQRTAFALLGIAPGPDIGPPAAASLTGTPPARTRTLLNGLVQASLLTRTAHGRYRMHDLLRRYAVDTAHRDLTGRQREAALRRVLDHHLHTAFAAERLLSPHRQQVRPAPPAPGTHLQPPADARAAVVWFEAEDRCLAAVQHVATALRRHDAAWQLAWHLDTLRRRRGRLHDQLTAWRAALVAVEHLADPALHVLVHRRLGAACTDLGRHDDAIDHLRHALALAERHHEPADRHRVHQALAWAWDAKGDHRQALHHATRALHDHRAAGNAVWEARAFALVGWCLAQLGDHDAARRQCRDALALFHHHDDPEAQVFALNRLGHIDHRTGRHREAVRHYRQALAVCRDLGDALLEADTLDHLGHPCTALGRHREARAVWREALGLYRAQGRDADVARVRRRLDACDGDQSLTVLSGS